MMSDCTAHSTPREPWSSASSTANGKRVPPPPLEAMAALVHSASSRSAGCTCVPSCVERARSRANASFAPAHICTSVRYPGPYCKPTKSKPSYSAPTSAACDGPRSDAWSTRCHVLSMAVAPEQCTVVASSIVVPSSQLRTSKRPSLTSHSMSRSDASTASGCRKYTPRNAAAPAARATSR
jgi:hypothetical protein